MHVIYLIAPSGYCIQQQAAQRGVTRLEQAGHRVLNQQAITRRFQRFAGPDDARLAELEGLLALPDGVEIVIPVRGGYGASRLLERADFPALAEAIRQKNLIVCGHSDFTALQAGLFNAGAITFSGPMLAGNFGAETMNAFTWHHFWQAISQPKFTLNWQTPGSALQVAGTLWGGNLAMLASLMGTRFFPQVENGILVVEDINEHPYKIERMLLQLYHSGILNKQRALILGSFTASEPNSYDDGYDFDTMVRELRERLSIPVLTGLAFGHEQDTVTLPLGAQATLSHDGIRASLALYGHPTIIG